MKMQMTLQEMQTKYPNKWLGINGVIRDNTRHILSANVVYTDKDASDIAILVLNGEDIQPFFTTPDDTFHVGAVM